MWAARPVSHGESYFPMSKLRWDDRVSTVLQYYSTAGRWAARPGSHGGRYSASPQFVTPPGSGLTADIVLMAAEHGFTYANVRSTAFWPKSAVNNIFRNWRLSAWRRSSRSVRAFPFYGMTSAFCRYTSANFHNLPIPVYVMETENCSDAGGWNF
ncbi:hypothetical protein J6590_004970 [Homalodisca vitripennis]|nr:hypothetical protein J6590_004970 [Homalodisca vitripennis]